MDIAIGQNHYDMACAHVHARWHAKKHGTQQEAITTTPVTQLSVK